MKLKKQNRINLLSRLKNHELNSAVIVLGKNGEGKSRLLVELIPEAKYYNYDNVIAVSTSPFDKFPIRKEFKGIKYNYVGVKGGSSGNSILSLISTASLGLLDYKKNKDNSIEKILSFLGASSEVEYVFKLNTTHSQLYTQRNLFGKNIYSTKAAGAEEKKLECTDEEFYLIDKYLGILNNSIDSNKNFRIRLHIGEIAYIRNQFEKNYNINELVQLLLRFNIIKLIDFRIEKKDLGWMSLRLASSGEQCILLSLLGITSNIDNNSLILIDEPEISLHPEWQERYITLMMQLFEKFYNCMFVIATHSPQMVSKLSPSRSFIYMIQSDELLDASEYSKRSSDFQLANLFCAPGYKNEYLTRVLISFLTEPLEYINTSKMDEINSIISLKKSVDPLDPVHKLIELAQKVLSRLA